MLGNNRDVTDFEAFRWFDHQCWIDLCECCLDTWFGDKALIEGPFAVNEFNTSLELLALGRIERRLLYRWLIRKAIPIIRYDTAVARVGVVRPGYGLWGLPYAIRGIGCDIRI